MKVAASQPQMCLAICQHFPSCLACKDFLHRMCEHLNTFSCRSKSLQDHFSEPCNLKRYRQSPLWLGYSIASPRTCPAKVGMPYNRKALGLSVAMLLVLQCYPCQNEEHDEEEKLNAKVLPLGDAVLWQPIILQELQHSHGVINTSSPKMLEQLQTMHLYSSAQCSQS